MGVTWAGLQAGPLDSLPGQTPGWGCGKRFGTRSKKSKFETATATVSPCVTGKARTQFEHLLVSDGGQWMAPPHPLSFSFVSFRKLSLSKITVAQYIIKIEEQAWFGVWWVRCDWGPGIHLAPLGSSMTTPLP